MNDIVKKGNTLPVPLYVRAPEDSTVLLKFHTPAGADMFWRRMSELMDEHAKRTQEYEDQQQANQRAIAKPLRRLT